MTDWDAPPAEPRGEGARPGGRSSWGERMTSAPNYDGIPTVRAGGYQDRQEHGREPAGNHQRQPAPRAVPSVPAPPPATNFSRPPETGGRGRQDFEREADRGRDMDIGRGKERGGQDIHQSLPPPGAQMPVEMDREQIMTVSAAEFAAFKEFQARQAAERSKASSVAELHDQHLTGNRETRPPTNTSEPQFYQSPRRASATQFSPGYGFRPSHPDDQTLPPPEELVNEMGSRHRVYPAPTVTSPTLNQDVGWDPEPEYDEPHLTAVPAHGRIASPPEHVSAPHDVTSQRKPASYPEVIQAVEDMRFADKPARSAPAQRQPEGGLDESNGGDRRTPREPSASQRELDVQGCSVDDSPQTLEAGGRSSEASGRGKKSAYIPWDGGVKYEDEELNKANPVTDADLAAFRAEWMPPRPLPNATGGLAGSAPLRGDFGRAPLHRDGGYGGGRDSGWGERGGRAAQGEAQGGDESRGGRGTWEQRGVPPHRPDNDHWGGNAPAAASNNDDWGSGGWAAQSTRAGDEGWGAPTAAPKKNDDWGVGGGGGGGCHKCGENGHFARECPTGGSDVCYNCSQPGHMSRDCPEPRKAYGGGGDRACYNCGQSGHQSRECTEERQPGSFRGTCNNCGKQGHMSRDCPEPRQDRGFGSGGGGGFEAGSGWGNNAYSPARETSRGDGSGWDNVPSQTQSEDGNSGWGEPPAPSHAEASGGWGETPRRERDTPRHDETPNADDGWGTGPTTARPAHSAVPSDRGASAPAPAIHPSRLQMLGGGPRPVREREPEPSRGPNDGMQRDGGWATRTTKVEGRDEGRGSGGGGGNGGNSGEDYSGGGYGTSPGGW